MTEPDVNKIKESLWLYYNDNINETQYYYRMNQAGVSKDDANTMFDRFCEYVNSYKSRQNQIICLIILLSISFLVFTTIWNFLT